MTDPVAAAASDAASQLQVERERELAEFAELCSRASLSLWLPWLTSAERSQLREIFVRFAAGEKTDDDRLSVVRLRDLAGEREASGVPVPAVRVSRWWSAARARERREAADVVAASVPDVPAPVAAIPVSRAALPAGVEESLVSEVRVNVTPTRYRLLVGPRPRRWYETSTDLRNKLF